MDYFSTILRAIFLVVLGLIVMVLAPAVLVVMAIQSLVNRVARRPLATRQEA